MADPNANINLNLKTTDFKRGINEAKDGFDSISRTGQSSFQSLKPPIDATTNSLGNLTSGSRDAVNGIKDISVSSRDAVTSLDTLGDSAERTGQKASRSFASTSGALIGLASSAGATVFAYQNLEKSQTMISKTMLTIEKKQAAINKLQEEGKQFTDQYKFAVKDLRLEEDRLTQAQEAADRANFNFGLGLITLGTTTIPNAIRSITSLFGSHAVAAGGAVSHTAANTGLTASVWKLNFSLLSNPFFAVATAASIAAAVALVATNTWGLRDAIFGTTVAVDENTDALNLGNQSLEVYASGLDSVGLSASGASKEIERFTDLIITGNRRIDEWFIALNKGINLSTQIHTLREDGTLGPIGPPVKKNDELIEEIIKSRFQYILDSDGEIKAVSRGAVTSTRNIRGVITSVANQLAQHNFNKVVNRVNALIANRGILGGLEGGNLLQGLGFISEFGGISAAGISAGAVSGLTSSAQARAFAGSGAARNRTGGHSAFRQDRLGGRIAHFQNFIAQDILDPSTRALAARLGIPIPQLRMPTTGGRVSNAQAQAAFAASQQRAFDEYRTAINSFQSRLSQALSELHAGIAARTGLSVSEVRQYDQTIGGQIDLENIERFHQREILAANAA